MYKAALYLLEYCPSLDVNAKDKYGTPLGQINFPVGIGDKNRCKKLIVNRGGREWSFARSKIDEAFPPESSSEDDCKVEY